MANLSKRWLRALQPVLVELARPPLRLLAFSWRLRWIAGAEALDRLAAEGQPGIYAHWHDSLYSAAYTLYRRQKARQVPLATLISQSRDGEFVARLCRPLRLQLVRGSTSRGAIQALRGMLRAMTRGRRSFLFAVDGPRGPARRAQPGALVLARQSGAPVLPLAAAADRAWRLGSWDRLVIPKPFARVTLAVGEPRWIERGADLAAECTDLARRLDELERACREQLERGRDSNRRADRGGAN